MGGPEKEKGPVVSTYEYAPELSQSSQSSLDEAQLRRRSVTPHPSDWRSWARQNYLSWRWYVLTYASLCLLSTVIILIAIVAAVSSHGVDKQGRITLFTGDCYKSKISSLFAHFFISGIGTYMLTASAYVMYCLSPPSREEIDREHAKGRWLDIGVMSSRNLFRISKKRVLLFCLLGITSPILQFFFNAFLFQTYSANAYTALIAQENFLVAKNYTVKFTPLVEASRKDFRGVINQLHRQAKGGQLEILSNRDCIEGYAVPLQSNRGNVIVVTENSPNRTADVFDAYEAPVPVQYVREGPEQYSWLCTALKLPANDQCVFHFEHLRRESTAWAINNAKVKYCLSEKVEEKCKLQFQLMLILVVFGVCLFKTIVMFVVAFWVYESPLMTTGDAIASFMTRPDPYTDHMCLASKRFIQSHPSRWRPTAPAYYSAKPKRLYESIRTRVITLCLLWVLGICYDGAVYCFLNESVSLHNLFKLGFGAINRRFFIGWHRKETPGMIKSAIFANGGHMLFGILYILYNNVFYSMIFADEWARYGTHRKGLRVSESPRGSQRTVYFFLMPYKLALPIMVFASAIHLLISQMVFVVDVEAYSPVILSSGRTEYQRQPQFDFNTTGFSPVANLGMILVSVLMLLFGVACCCQRLKSGMPVTSTCSAAIAAACHPSAKEHEDAPLMELRWGVTDEVDGVGHCTFSAQEVGVPNEKTPYL